MVVSANDKTSLKHLKRDEKYFLPGGDLHLLAKDTVFKVHSFFWSRESPLFKDFNDGKLGLQGNGLTESTAVVLDHDVSPEALQKFLWCFYNEQLSLYEAPVDDWKQILDLATRLEFPGVKELAIRELQKKEDIPTVERLIIYQSYKVDDKYVLPLYGKLCAQDEPLSVEEAEKLGARATALIFRTREMLRANPNPDEKRSKVLLAAVKGIVAQLSPSPGASTNGKPVANGHTGTQR